MQTQHEDGPSPCQVFSDLIARKLSGADRCDAGYLERIFARQYWPDRRRTFFPQLQERLNKYFSIDERVFRPIVTADFA